MQINGVSSSYGFGALSPELQENMWQAVKRNRPQGYQNINKSKLYQDYKYILNNTKGDDSFYVEYRHNHDNGWIHDKMSFNTLAPICNVSKAYSTKDPYKEIIKIFASWLRDNK